MTVSKIIYLLAEILGVEEDDLTEETAFTAEYGIEPIDVAKLVIAAERKFQVTIYDDEASAFQTVADVAKHIDRLLEQA